MKSPSRGTCPTERSRRSRRGRHTEFHTSLPGRRARYSRYDEKWVTFGEDDVYDQADAAGFIRLYGLSSRVSVLKSLESAGTHDAWPTPSLDVAAD